MIRIADIQRAIADTYGLPVEVLRHPDGAHGIRERRYVRPRQIGMYLARQMCATGAQRSRISLTTIGRKFGGRDHTTVLHGCRVIDSLIRSDTEERRAIGEIGWLLIERSQ